MPPLDKTAQDYLASGRALRNGAVPTDAAPTGQPTQTISTSSLSPVPSLNFQTPPPSTIFPVASLATAPLAPTQPEQQANDLTSSLMKLNENLVGQSADRAALETSAGIPGQQQTITNLTSRLNSLIGESQAIPLQLQEQFQGRGVTAGGLNPVQTGALRRNAIASLGVKAQLEAAQGNLASSLDYIDRAVAQKYDPIKEEIAAKTANLNLILNSPAYSLAEKNRAQAQLNNQNATQRVLDAQAESYKVGQSMASAAIKNNPGNQAASDAAQRVLALDPADPMYLQKVYALVGTFQSDPNKVAQDVADLAYKNAQTRLLNAQTVKTNAEAAQASGQSDVTAQTFNERSNAINLVNTILGNSAFKQAVGANRIFNLQNYTPGTAVQTVKNQMKQLVAILALENRSKLKGSGQISDFESRTLERAASAFGPNQSEADARQSLIDIRGTLTTLNGGQAPVTIKDPSNSEQVDALADTNAINSAIQKGYVVQYR